MKKKNVLNKIKALFEEVETNVEEKDYVEVKTEDGKILRVDVLAVEEKVVEITEDGEVEVEDGDYVLEDGKTLKIEDNKISEIVEKEEEDKEDSTEMEFAELEQVHKWTINVTAEKIEVGTVLKTKDSETGDESIISAGEYEMGDKKVQVDADGKVVLITDIKEEEETKTEVDEDVSEEEFKSILEGVEKLTKSFNEFKSEMKVVKEENKELKNKVEKFGESASDKHTSTKFEINKSGMKKYF